MAAPLHGITAVAVGVDDAGRALAGLLKELGAPVTEVAREPAEPTQLDGFAIVIEGPEAAAELRAAELDPATIRCRITPFGDVGPFGDRPGSDLTVQALAGMMSVTGYPGEPPTRIGPPVFAHVAALFALIGVLAALTDRDTTGLGQEIDVAAFDCAIAYLAPYVPLCLADGRSPGRQGNRGTTTVPWDVYPTADGRLVICTSTDAQWKTLLQLAGREDLVGDERFESASARLANVEAVDEIVSAWTGSAPTADILAIAAENRIPAGVVKSLAEVRRDRPVGTPVLRVPASAAEPGGPRPSAGGTSPLAGLKVVEIGHYTAGPYCGRILAGLGADVIKVEPLAGEPMRHFRPKVGGDGYFFHLNNVGKRSVRLDLRSDDGLATARSLLADADVLIENMGAGSLDRLGLGYEDLRETNPRLVYASIKGFGAASRRLAYDTIIQAEGGMMATTGQPESGPVRAGISISDALGSTLAAADVLVALRARGAAGEGSFVDVSMLDGTAWSTDGLPAATPLPLGNRHPTRVPQGCFRAADGFLVIGVESDAQWQALARLAALATGPERCHEAGRLADEATIESELADWCAERDRDAIVAVCLAAGVPAAPVLEVEDALRSDEVDARRMLVPVAIDGEDAPVAMLALPLSLSRSRLSEPRPIGIYEHASS